MNTRIEIDALTGEITEHELTASEIEQRETDRVAYETQETQRQNEAIAKASARIALLERLGITEEEAQLLK